MFFVDLMCGAGVLREFVELLHLGGEKNFFL